MADLGIFLPLFTETEETIRERMDTQVNAGIDPDDPSWVDPREGHFFHDITQVDVLEFARLWDALSIEVPAAAFPLYAWGQYLDDHAAVFTLERKVAVAASGEATFTGDPGVFIAQGTTISADALSDTGETIEFQTTESGTTGALVDTPGPVTPTATEGTGTLDAGTYSYVVTAVNEFGETEGSAVVATATLGTAGNIALDWADVTGAASYRVYRGASSDGPFYRLANPSVSAYTDDGSDSTSPIEPPTLNTTAGVTLAVMAAETGTIGNLAAGAISNLEVAIVGLDMVRNDLPITGGADTESDEELRLRIFYEFEGRGPGNQNDYRRWALAYPGVGKVYVVPAASGPGTVGVVILDSEGNAVPTDIVDGLQALLDPVPGAGEGLAPIGATVTVLTPTIISIAVAAVVTFDSGYNLDGGSGAIGLRGDIEAALTAYIGTLAVGDDVVYDHVKAQFYTVPGVHSVASVTVNAGTSNVAISSSPAEIAELGTTTLS